jgi:hypothetical protein
VHEEASAWVAAEVARLRALDYPELLRHQGHALHCEMLSCSGEVLVRETQVFWDDKKRQTLRVIVDVWRPKKRGIILGRRASDDFIRAPDGSFIDE